MWQKGLMAAALAGSLMLVGCGSGGGGGGSNGGNGGGPGGGPEVRNDVAGPLDAIQGPVSNDVLKQLADATAGTPLAGVVDCADQIVVGDALDIVDIVLLQVQGASGGGVPNFDGAAAEIQAEVENLVADLQGLLFSLAGGNGCGGLIPAPGGGFTNPLVGTPLEPFAAALISTLTSVQDQLTGGGAPDLGLLTELVGELADGYNTALALLPAEATDAPIVGPTLGLVGTALNDVETTVGALSSADVEATVAALTATVDHLLTGLLTDVLPIGLLEQGGGAGGAVTGPIQDVLAQITGLLGGLPGGDLGGADSLVEALLDTVDSLLAPLTGAIPGGGAGGDPTSILTELLGAITGALGGTGGTGGLPIPNVGGDALNNVLAQLTGLLGGADLGGGLGGGLLDPVLDLLDEILGGLLGGGGLGGLGGL